MSADMTGRRGLRLVMTTDAVGGVWRYSVDLASALTGRGVEVVMLCLGPGPDQHQRREARGISGLTLRETDLPLDWLCEEKEALRQAAAKLARTSDQLGADIVQLNGCPLAGLAEFPVPVVALHHSCFVTWWRAVRNQALPAELQWRFDLLAGHLAAADVVVAPTRSFASVVADAYRLPSIPNVVLNGRCGIAGRFSEDPVPALFTAGRLWDEGKNLDLLDRVAARLSAPVLAAGPTTGPNGAELRSSCLKLLGPLSEAEIRRRLAQTPIFISAAIYEPFGLAALEAAQAGCALILSDIATFRELWDGAALFASPNDECEMAAAAKTLLGDAGLRRRLGQAALDRARFYDVETMAASMMEIYSSLALPEAALAPAGLVA